MPADGFTSLFIPAMVTRGIQRPNRHLPFLYRSQRMDSINDSPAIPWLNFVKSGHAVRNIFNKPSCHRRSCHFFKTGGNRGDFQAVCGECAKRHCSGFTDYGKCSIFKDAICVSPNIMPFRYNPEIIFPGWFPFSFPARCNTGVKKCPERRINVWPDREDFPPYRLGVQGTPQVIRYLLGDYITVRVRCRRIPFKIKPDRAGMNAHKVSDRYWSFLSGQCSSSSRNVCAYGGLKVLKQSSEAYIFYRSTPPCFFKNGGMEPIYS